MKVGRRLRLTALAVGALGLGIMTTAAGAQAGGGGQPTAQPYELLPPEVFIDKRGEPTHGGTGPHPSTETSKFRLLGRFSWFDEGDVPPGLPADNYTDSVAYTLTPAAGSVPVAFRGAVGAGIETVDGFVDTRDFVRDDNNPTSNPCGGSNQVEWVAIDGPGGTLAQTFVCPARATGGLKLIVGFRIQFDSADAWSTAPSASQDDVESVAVHEFGHGVGLDHVSSWRDGCLTMYQFIAPGTTYKRLLGWGDKVGLSKLYTVPNTTQRGDCGL